jgi:muconolactone D-isomerase
MREFLIEFALEIPEGTEQAEVDRRLAAESMRAAELESTGALYRLWRPLGRSCTLGVFRSADKSELGKVLGTLPLPLPPWLTVRITPLVSHPGDPGGTDHA